MSPQDLKAWSISSSLFVKDLLLVIALVNVWNKARGDKSKRQRKLMKVSEEFSHKRACLCF